jgi:transcriptional regulator with XRE-family HTH domain
VTQDALAHRAGIAVPTLSQLERGYANPTWATLRDIAAALGVSMAELAKAAEKFED